MLKPCTQESVLSDIRNWSSHSLDGWSYEHVIPYMYHTASLIPHFSTIRSSVGILRLKHIILLSHFPLSIACLLLLLLLPSTLLYDHSSSYQREGNPGWTENHDLQVEYCAQYPGRRALLLCHLHHGYKVFQLGSGGLLCQGQECLGFGSPRPRQEIRYVYQYGRECLFLTRQLSIVW